MNERLWGGVRAEGVHCRRSAGAARAQGPGSAVTGRSAACRQTTRGGLGLPLCTCCVFQNPKVSFTPLGISRHAMLSANGSRGHTFNRDEDKTACLSGADAWGVPAPPACARGPGGFPGIPRMWEQSPETCASCPGLGSRAGCWWESRNKFWMLVGPLPTARTAGRESARHSSLFGCPARVHRAQEVDRSLRVSLGIALCLNVSSQDTTASCSGIQPI